MSITQEHDVSFNISTDIKESHVDLETGEFNYCVAEFYEVYKDRLPCLVVVDQGFCSPLTEDTFDKDQMLLLKTTSSQKRVLGKMVCVERRQQLLISLPANYKEKLFIIKNGKADKEATLDVILKENALPCTVAYADLREVIAGDRIISTRGITTIELTELFDEVYFLGNCVHYGQLALNVIQVPFYLSLLTFKLVKGFKDRSRSSFNEYIEKLLLVSSFLNYNIPCGNMNIAEYEPTAVQSKEKLSRLQPNIYTDYVTLIQRPTSYNYSKLDVPKLSSQNTNGNKTTAKRYTTKKGTTDNSANVNMNRNSSSQTLLQQNRPLPSLPRDNAPPPTVPDRKFRPEPFTILDEAVYPKTSEVQAFCNRNEPKVHTDKSRDIKPFEPKPDYDKASIRDEKRRVAVGKAFPILATQNQDLPQLDDDGTANSTEQSGKRLIDVKSLSINDVCECLTRLNLHTYRKAFRDDMIDGDLLMDIDKDTLCTYFGMNRIEALRLVKFAATGRIPT